MNPDLPMINAAGSPAPAGASAAMRRASVASVAMALTLIALKTWAWRSSGSTAMLGSLMDSALDLVASLATFMAVRLATTPADANHRFGHGKAEALAGLFQAAIITGSAAFLLLEAARRIATPAPVAAPELGIAVSLAAMAATVALVAYQRHVVRTTGSLAIHADSAHYTGDLLLNGSVIAAFVAASYFGILWLDPALALFIAGILGWTAWGLARGAVNMLMDREWEASDREAIVAAVLANRAVIEVHELRTRTSGTDAFIQFHITVDPKMTVLEAHTVSDEIEARLGELYPNAEILIHVDPRGLKEHGQEAVY